ncbi:MAG TPA: ABC transporter ATP-binding protein, partial [Corynebacterium variabile]|nr:ABC transporter ATP-binding protein [Corynebacterium variabile]
EAQGGRDLSVLWVSHDPAQVQRIADRSIRIDAGQVTA